MNSFVVTFCLLAASASAGFVGVPHVTTTQYHSQDALGQYSYGYSGGPSAKEETRTADGVTRGSYSYVDANGIVQSASYVSDPVHGFRVAATNLPQAPSAVVTGPSVVASAPAVVAAAPAVVRAAPAYVAAAPAVVRTAPAYVAAAPAYVAAAHTAVAAAPGFDHVNGVPLETPEVVAAKAAHFAAHGAALARLGRRWKRSLVAAAPTTVSVAPGSTTVVSGPVGKSFSYSTVAAAPNVAAAPAAVSYAAPAVAVAPAAVSYSAPAAVGVAPGSATVISGPYSRSYSYSSVSAAPAVAAVPAVSYSAYAPAAVVAPRKVISYSAPAVVAAPVVSAAVPLSSQYRVQDGFGQYTYGYSDGLSSKTESRTADGVTHGGYSYLDSNGIVQSVKYVADAAGFRVHATNLPVGPSH